ncbi:MAG: DNA polymerase III subunit tau [Candidatus Marinimicrobia bacterium ADurb.Bin030]|nr:MAG: DNA polymerase III subunit tau [Candidatus Marinimicrobia bacterium ADurb.Bin030]HPB00750.1 DNA polymerase III subunit delta' [Candidatus Neomarinimicrobiota bacterium]HPN74896.1 DNA polymerase III subunit delta' [Candidatus Neomarinimicrobiota bacterium]HPY01397.1 DNA polymerase III subunit delta' [Candidatus Neomarinimicrobiota bacterium]HQO74846.1 DNA polymerase III subunit delta' [Candidatus Neomarinimicrobiota bacterium]
MTLFPLINQTENRNLLRNIVATGRVANTYLFYGPEGSGTEGFALEFAAMLNCSSKSERPCGICQSCKQMKTLEHPNLTLVFPIPGSPDSKPGDSPFKKFKEGEMDEIRQIIQNKSRNPYDKIIVKKALVIPINFIREIKRHIYLAPQNGGQKVVVIFDAHLMNDEAANAFLKILEEPPDNSTIILSTAYPDQLLPTVQSRCQWLYFPPLPEAELKEFLIKKGYPLENIRLAIRLSGGNVSQLTQLIEHDLSDIKELTLAIFLDIAAWKVSNLYNHIQKMTTIYRQDPEKFAQLMQSLIFWIRDAELIRQGQPIDDIIHLDYAERLTNFVKKFPDFDAQNMKVSVENCVDFINKNVYINLALIEMFFKLKKQLNNSK